MSLSGKGCTAVSELGSLCSGGREGVPFAFSAPRLPILRKLFGLPLSSLGLVGTRSLLLVLASGVLGGLERCFISP